MKASLINIIATMIALHGAVPAFASLPQVLTPLAAAKVGSSATTDRIEPLFAVPSIRDRAGRLVAPVFINGRGPFRFMLDTGASNSAVTMALVDKLGLVPDPAARASVRGVSGVAVVPTVYLDELTAGAIRLQSLQVPVLAGSAIEEFDGVLGMDGLGNMRITADFVRDRISISLSKGRPAGRRYTVLPGKPVAQHLLMVDALVSGVKIKAVIDTGASHTLGNPALLSALSRRRSFRGHAPIASVADATATFQDGEMHVTPQIDLNGASVRGADVTFSDFAIFHAFGLTDQPAVLIGMDILGTLGEVAIDYQRHELQLRMRQPRLVRRM
jgi:predicted aspartyl protease